MEKFPENDEFKITSRAAALNEHWKKIRQDRPRNPDDVHYPPLVPAPSDKPKDWQIAFTDSAREEAERYYQALKTQREYAYRFWQTKPPMPMGWAPQDGDAWAKTARAKVESGDLFHSRLWSPIWMDFGLASMDVLFAREESGMTQEETDEYLNASTTAREMGTSLQGRNLRSEDILKV